jgi:hypothetical protein
VISMGLGLGKGGPCISREALCKPFNSWARYVSVDEKLGEEGKYRGVGSRGVEFWIERGGVGRDSDGVFYCKGLMTLCLRCWMGSSVLVVN